MNLNRLLGLTIALSALAAPGFAFSQEQGRVALGKLGQAIEPAKIHQSASAKSKVYYTTKEFEYLVINPYEDTAWVKVLLTNGKHGFIAADSVAKLPYTVTAPKQQSRGTTASRDMSKAVEISFEYMGAPYKFGGTNAASGIDCSAFVQDVFEKIGVDLPRTAAEQYKVGTPVTRLEDLQAGDRLYFWDKKRNLIGHTGMFIGWREDGGAYFIHSSSNNKGVATDDLRNTKWRNLLVAARR
jgi:cell wall-associated NlpC family hydrolase